ncbi:glycoside hydrolase family 2 TIM barrel-domain containing protein [Arthrobacter sp. NPDC056691]|uniref:glycoside hydrolase family 2 TIM barrel-domain containing protein n=1 Tax=Arthrobacter sp. NPDC056691 TaxID=3345913 RepID=UPI00366C0BF2
MLRTSFNDGWTVHAEHDAGAPPVGPVTLPYDAMLHEPRTADTPAGMGTGFHPGGRYRYTKRFQAPEQWRDRSVLVEFEGVYHRSEVYLNGELIGGRRSGYAVFHVPLTAQLRFGEENTLEVVADTTDQPNSRWYSGSGIYRPVNVLVGGLVHVPPFGARFATTRVDTDGTATLVATVDLVNDDSTEQEVRVEVSISAPGGSELAGGAETVTLSPGARTSVRLPISVGNAELWSPDSPQLHDAGVRITDGADLLDAVETQTGLRTITVDSTHGFRINGTPYKLRGACIHHDNGVIGAVELDAAADRRVRILKAAGYNAIRSSHNPTSPAILRACDRHGLMVMDELSDAWYFPKLSYDYGLDFETEWERDLEAMIARGFNHPSVVMWSIGNEIAETSQPKGIALGHRIAGRTRELDPTRPVTNGINLLLNTVAPDDAKKAESVAKARENGHNASKNMITILNFAMSALEKVMPLIVAGKRTDTRTKDAFAALDVAGYNYGTGRYRKDHQTHPDRVIVGSETVPPQLFKNWALVEELPWVIGDFQWTGWDYIGEAGISVIRYGEPRRLFLPYPALLAGTPVVDITGHLQTQAHLNQIIWGLRAGPVIAVQPVNHAGQKQSKTGWRSTNSIASWSWEGYEGKNAVIEVYANAHRIDLNLNGRTIGSRIMTVKDQYLATFKVPYEPGELTAITYDRSGREIARDTLRSAGTSLRIQLSPEADTVTSGGEDLLFVPIAFTDEDGIVRPLADREVTVDVDGDGELLGSGSGNPITADEFSRGQFTTFYGRGLAVIRPTAASGTITVTVTATGCRPASVTVPVTNGNPTRTENSRPARASRTSKKEPIHG